jgi:hypothetical protein
MIGQEQFRYDIRDHISYGDITKDMITPETYADFQKDTWTKSTWAALIKLYVDRVILVSTVYATCTVICLLSHMIQRDIIVYNTTFDILHEFHPLTRDASPSARPIYLLYRGIWLAVFDTHSACHYDLLTDSNTANTLTQHIAAALPHATQEKKQVLHLPSPQHIIAGLKVKPHIHTIYMYVI